MTCIVYRDQKNPNYLASQFNSYCIHCAYEINPYSNESMASNAFDHWEFKNK